MNIGAIKNTSSNKILFHVIIWVFFILTSLIQFYESPFTINNDFYVQWFTGIILFYLNYFYLVPTLLLEKKILALFCFCTGTYYSFYGYKDDLFYAGI